MNQITNFCLQDLTAPASHSSSAGKCSRRKVEITPGRKLFVSFNSGNHQPPIFYLSLGITEIIFISLVLTHDLYLKGY